MSVCLRHQDRQTDLRCAACLRPICQECVVVGPGNSKFCSPDCRDNAQKSSERFADMTRRDEAALRADRQATFSRLVLTLVVLVVLAIVLYVAWPNLPEGLTGPVNQVFKAVRTFKLY